MLDGGIEQIAHLTCIAKRFALLLKLHSDDSLQLVLCFLGKIVVFLGCHRLEYVEEFLTIVVINMETMSESAGKSGIDIEKFIHLVLVTSNDNHKLATVVLHTFHEGLYGFLTIGIIVATERVGLVDEEDTSHCLIAHAVDNLGSLAHIFAHQCGTTGFHDTVGGQDIHTLQNLAHHTCQRSLACTRIARKHKVGSHLLYTAYTLF